MPKGCNENTHGYLINTVYAGVASTDLTSNIIRRLKQLSGEMTARLKAIFSSAGSPN